MLIKTPHAKALLELLEKDVGTLDNNIAYVLELQNLIQLTAEQTYALTYMGAQLARLIRDLIEKGQISPVDKWKHGAQFIDSRVITAIVNSKLNSDRVGPLGAQVLLKRGLAMEKNGKYVISEEGERLYDIYNKLDFRLQIDNDLWAYVRQLPSGPALSSRIDFDDHQIEKLEAMRLVSFSLPKGGVFAFTLLGQKVKELVEYTVAWDELSIVFDDDIIWLYKRAQIGGIEGLAADEQDLLEALGYIRQGEPTPAWKLIGEIINILEHQTRYRVRTFDIELPEVYLLNAIHEIWQKFKNNPEEVATKERLYSELFLKSLKKYKGVKAFYGRRLRQDLGSNKREELEKRFKEFDTLEEVFLSFYNNTKTTEARLMDIISDMLFSLESFGLISTEEFKGKKVYSLTQAGKQVLNDMKKHGFSEIRSMAVKSLTIGFNEIVAPTNEWFEKAIEEGLVSELGITERGKFYKRLAYSIQRLPYLTAFETEVFRRVPLDGSTKQEILEHLKHLDSEAVEYALGKLEARGFIRILPDGGIMLTNRGKLLSNAIAGARTRHPINPLVIRVVKALAEVGSLYVKELKTRKVPDELKKAVRLSGLDEESFMDALLVARASGFVGTNGLSKEGKALLELLKRL